MEHMKNANDSKPFFGKSFMTSFVTFTLKADVEISLENQMGSSVLLVCKSIFATAYHKTMSKAPFSYK